MMTAMPRPRPPFLRREVTRHGIVVWYVRKGEGQRVRIRAAFGTTAFDAEYQAALNATPRPVKGGSAAGSIAWLIRALSGNECMDEALTGKPEAKTEYARPGHQGCGQSAVH